MMVSYQPSMSTQGVCQEVSWGVDYGGIDDNKDGLFDMMISWIGLVALTWCSKAWYEIARELQTWEMFVGIDVQVQE